MDRRWRMIRLFRLAVLTLGVTAMPHGVLAQPSSLEEIQAAAMRQIQTGQFRAAADALRKGLRTHSKSAELWNLLGISDSELHQNEAAKKAFEQGLKLAPESTSLNENIGFLFFREANYRSAKRYLQRAVQLGSQNPGVRFSLAASELRIGEQTKALGDLKPLESALGGVSDYWAELGTAELSQNDPGAETSFERALQIDPNNITALNGAASVAEKQGLDEKALSFLIRAQKSNPDDVPTLLHFGTVCIRRDLGIDALAAAKKAYGLQPANNYALYLLARANISQQNWQQAYDEFAQFAQRMPKFAPAYYAMGWLDTKLDKTEDAKRQLEHALTLDPDLADARALLAQVYLDNGELDTAQQLFEKVLQQSPKDAKANSGMGSLLLRKGKLDEAQHYLEAAIESAPKDGSAHYKLSQVLLRKHETERAKKERTLALTLNSEAKRASKTVLKLAMPNDPSLP